MSDIYTPCEAKQNTHNSKHKFQISFRRTTVLCELIGTVQKNTTNYKNFDIFLLMTSKDYGLQ